MRVLITGAAGFIGSNLVHYLLQERPQWTLTALDSLSYAGNLENLQAPLAEKRVELVKCDIRQRDEVFALFSKTAFDLVFHLAAESHVDRSIHNPVAFVETNVMGTQHLLDAARTRQARFVHVSTDEVYGSLGPTGRFVETTPLRPSSPYSASKASSDLLALAAFHTHGMNVVVTRCTNNYGPYQFPEKFIPLFVTNAIEGRQVPLYGDGSNVRSWLYVTDHCDALLKVGEQGRAGEVYNIGGMEEAEEPNREVAFAILDLLGKPRELVKFVTDRPGHDWRYAIDYTKIHSELGWLPRTPFEDGLQKTVQWYKDNTIWWQRVKSGEYQKFYELNYSSR